MNRALRRARPLWTLILLAALIPAPSPAHRSWAGDPGGEESARPPAVVAQLPAVAAVPTPAPPNMTLPRQPVPQGGSFLVIVEGAGIAAVSVTFAGRAYPAVPDGGGWLAVIGVGQRAGLTEQHPPGTYPVQATVSLDGGDIVMLTGEVTVTATDFPVEAITLDPATAALLDPALIERELAVLRRVLAEFTPTRRWDGFFVRPTQGPITDVFGSRRSFNGGPPTGSHSGVDFGAPAGAPVVAAAPGRVAFAGPLPVRGNAVYIDHGLGVVTGYDHLSHIAVQPGQEVQAGEPIGAVGATGLATGPHLHWEVAVAGYFVNGLLWLPPE